MDSPIAVGNVGADPETTRGCFPHPALDLLGKILRVELVHALNDRLHQLARWRVIRVLGDRGDADPATTEHRLERDRVLALAGEARELPNQNLLERSVILRRFVQHLAKLWPVCDSAALRLIDVLARHDVAIALGEIAQGAHLGGD